MDNKVETKKMNTGKIGFILSLVLLAISFPLFNPIFLILFVSLVLPPLLLCLLILLSFFFSAHGLIKKRSQKLAMTSLPINALNIVILFIFLISLTPPGSMPSPLNVYKFKRTCPNASFWLDFDKAKITKIQSQSLFIFGNVSTIHFRPLPDAYSKEKIIQYAKTNGWKYHLSIPASKFLYILEANEDDLSLKELEFKVNLTSINPISMVIEKEDCLQIFETGNYLGSPSFIVISQNSNSFKVYCNNPSRPDPGRGFELPEMF